jgi:hypothetical protein
MISAEDQDQFSARSRSQGPSDPVNESSRTGPSHCEAMDRFSHPECKEACHVRPFQHC